MTDYHSSLLRLLDERGYIHQITDAAALDARAADNRITGYIGFDATAPSLHVGNLVSIMMLRRLQQAGHRPIVLMGGGTTKVGDPSGRDTTRTVMTDEKIAENIASIRAVFERFLDFDDADTGAILVNNDDWLSKLEYIPFLRDIGQHFTINRMLTFDSVKLRLDREQPLSFLEFNYMILQGYDFLELYRREDCVLQMGGSDQWGNIVNGMELVRRVAGGQAYGLTTPLITTADGKKMGKTAAGAVWLNTAQLPDYDYWQFWRNTQDADVGRFLRIFTDLPLDEIARLETLEGAEINAAKIELANAATTLCRGEAAAMSAAKAAAAAFAGGTDEDLPHVDIRGPVNIVDALVAIGFASSKGEARRLVKGGGARIDGEAVAENHNITMSRETRISAGKKRHGLLRPI
ncbi:MAG: tyrosine--tRNA ligase [Pseudomonadota bacterium]